MSQDQIQQRKEYNKIIFLWIVNYFEENNKIPILEEIGKAFNFSRERAR